MTTYTRTNVGTDVSVSEILKILKEKDITPENAWIETESDTEENSYGDTHINVSVYLVTRKTVEKQ
jgi:hypothetical protein